LVSISQANCIPKGIQSGLETSGFKILIPFFSTASPSFTLFRRGYFWRSRSPCFDSLIWVKWSINPTNFWCEAVTSYWQWKTREGIRRISFQWQCTCFVNPCLNLRVFSMFLI
jgi:hypothetical protein